MKTLCEDHPQIGESELIRNQCPRCVADLRAQLAECREGWDGYVEMERLRAQVTQLTEQRDKLLDAVNVEWELRQTVTEQWKHMSRRYEDTHIAMQKAQAQVTQLTEDLTLVQRACKRYAEKAAGLQAQVATLTEALRRIVEAPPVPTGDPAKTFMDGKRVSVQYGRTFTFADAQAIARAALAQQPEEPSGG